MADYEYEGAIARHQVMLAKNIQRFWIVDFR